MEYLTKPKVDTKKILLQKFEETLNLLWNHSIDLAQLEFCADVRTLVEDQEDQMLLNGIDFYLEAKQNAEVLLDRIKAKLEYTPDDTEIKVRRKNWLTTFISQLETKHATNAMFIDLNEGLNVDDVEKLVIEQIRIEGGLLVATSELNSIP